MRQEDATTANFSLPAGESRPIKKARGRPKGSKNGKKLMASMQQQTKTDPINPSGIGPTEFKVLIRPDAVDDTISAPGGTKFILPIDVQTKEKQASQSGIIVAVSPLAFSYERWPDGTSPPKVGQRAIFAKYAGYKRKGKDGVEYVLMNDRDVAATFEE